MCLSPGRTCCMMILKSPGPGPISQCHFVVGCGRDQVTHQSMTKYEFDDYISTFTTEVTGRNTNDP